MYEWRVCGVCDAGDTSVYSGWSSFTTARCVNPQYAEVAVSDTTNYIVPFNNYYNYSYVQMLYTAAEIGGPIDISAISFNYSSQAPTSAKDNCAIYLGHTSKTQFNGTSLDNLVPLSSLHKVYEGPISCVQGWNEILLDSTFAYDGTSNIVVAIDDNSGGYDGSSFKFYCTRSSDDSYPSLILYSDNHNPDPASSSFSGSKGRRRFKADIRFTGCEAGVAYNRTVEVYSASEQQGSVTGSGVYEDNSEVTITATPATGYDFDYWQGGTTRIYINPYTFTVTCDTTFVAYFKQKMHHISVSGSEWGNAYIDDGADQYVTSGDYPYGTILSLRAEPRTDIANTICTFVSWNDGNSDNPRSVTLTQDENFTAVFNAETVGIETTVVDNVTLAVNRHDLIVTGAADKDITIFDIGGRTIYQAHSNGESVFHMPSTGVYIVCIEGNAPRKVVIIN